VRELVPALGASLFEVQMLHLARHYRPVRASELLEAVAERPRGERFPVAVTFDDDDPRHVAVVLPILERVGILATFFLNRAGRRFWWEQLQQIWDRGVDPSEALGLTPSAPAGDPRRLHELSETIQALRPERRLLAVEALARLAGEDDPSTLMTAEAVAEIERSGHELGFHTSRHEPLTTLADADLEAELSHSGVPVIAYPYGKVDDRVAAAARAAGFTHGYTTDARAVFATSDPLRLGRLLPSFDSGGHFALHLARRLILGA
jgi:peptidoglycan/xylan/chitin deacetylase (PgdA/CDA1 family)